MKKKPVALIADDDFSIRLLACETLEQADFQVKEAENGREAIEIFQYAHPEIVLLDVRMPVMNGFDVCKAIRSLPEGKDVPILMVTGSDDIESIQAAYDIGATDFMTKPINWLILSQRVRYMFRASRNVEKLRKSEASLAAAQRIARMGSWELNIGTDEFGCSAETLRIYGIQPDTETNCEHLLSHIHPDDRNRVKKLFDRSKNQGKPFQVDHRILLPDGTEKIVHKQANITFDDTGKSRQIIGTVQDITRRKLSESLESSRNRVLEMIIQNAPLREIMNQLVGIIEIQQPDAMCALSLFNAEQLCLQAASSSLIPFIESAEESCSDTAARTGEVIVISDIAKGKISGNERERALNHGIASCCAFPIISGENQILGTISVYHRTPCWPDRSYMNLLEIVAKLAAVAIEQRRLNDELAHQARHDVLTGLPNRAAVAEYLNQALNQAATAGEKVAVLFIDLDRFKHINDSLGHHVGDRLLNAITRRFRSCVQENSIIGRMGGDEFMHIVKGIRDSEEVSRIAANVRDMLASPFELEERNLYIGASIGICIYPEDGRDAITLQKNSDTAMFYAKNEGGNRFRFFSPEMNMAAIERLEIENELRKSVEQGNFELYYQPKYELSSNRLAGFEALLRWNHPVLGRVPPNKFIPIAEESELIIPIGTWVIQEACRQNVAWEQAGYGAFKIAVNVSVVQFIQNNFVDLVEKTLRDHRLPPDRLELEVTESVVVNDLSLLSRRLSELQGIGVATAIDDFGTGYSSMSYLHQLPINCLKIDQSFVQKMSETGKTAERSRMMLRTIVGLAHDLNLNIVAEGLENKEELDFLRQIGCDLGQGYYFSLPLSVEEVEERHRKDADDRF